jgi:hypothetical protein
MLAILQLEDRTPSSSRLEYWMVGIMRQIVGILASESELGFAILPWKSSYVVLFPAAGRAVAVLAGSKDAALVDNDWVRHVEAATVSIGNKSTENARDDSRCRTDNAREVPGSVGVASAYKEDAPAVACVVS